MILYFQPRGQVQPFSFVVVFYNLVMNVLDILCLIIWVFFSSIQNVLPLKQEVALHTCKLQGECQAVTVMRAAPGQCHPHRTSDERGPIGPQLGSKCLKSELQMMSLLFLHSLCSP